MLIRRNNKAILEAVRKKEDNGNNPPLLPFPQNIPQYIEVPPNIEVKQIPSYFYTVLSSQSNHLLLKDISKLLIFFGCWQAICNHH
jgi:hypothetical protein